MNITGLHQAAGGFCSGKHIFSRGWNILKGMFRLKAAIYGMQVWIWYILHFPCTERSPVKGTTLEYYYNEIEGRKEFWSRYGNLDKLTVRYENIFDTEEEKGIFNIVVLQDTLHHLEPVDAALRIFRDSLKPGGRVIAIEENGSSVFIITKNLLKRGLSKKKEYFDETLGKSVIMADEHARSLYEWGKVLKNIGLGGTFEAEYIRLLPPCFFTDKNYGSVIDCEQRMGKSGYFPSKYFFFGINFIAEI
jgi:SAM-dependent methyltransferase